MAESALDPTAEALDSVLATMEGDDLLDEDSSNESDEEVMVLRNLGKEDRLVDGSSPSFDDPVSQSVSLLIRQRNEQKLSTGSVSNAFALGGN